MLGQRYPREPVPRGKTADQHLRDLTEAGLQMALSATAAASRCARLAEKELAFIAEQQDRALFPDRA